MLVGLQATRASRASPDSLHDHALRETVGSRFFV
jgi:hypothetical protein